MRKALVTHSLTDAAVGFTNAASRSTCFWPCGAVAHHLPLKLHDPPLPSHPSSLELKEA